MAGVAAKCLICIFTLSCSAQDAHVLRITLDLAPAAMRFQSADVAATVTNISDHPVVVHSTEPLRDYALVVTDCDGSRVPLSERGRTYYAQNSATPPSDVTLAPRGSHVDGLPINSLYDFVRPGCYHVTARREFEPAHETDVSNTLEVTLK